MKKFSFNTIAHWLNLPDHLAQDIVFTGVTTDSRHVKAGQLFIAVKGEYFNGNEFVHAAAQQGAVAAIVDQTISDAPIPCLQVANTRLSLGHIAQQWRLGFEMPLVALTGSCGKTTTKTLLANILSQLKPTLATEGTLNNDLGVPLTLLRLNKDYAYAVIELGANHPGEINYLANLARPQIALITCAAPVHLEGFGTTEGVAQAKGEIYGALPTDGVALINIDDDFAPLWLNINSKRKVITFGCYGKADVMAQNILINDDCCPTFTLVHGDESIEIHLPLMGEHNVTNAMAAAAAAIALNVPLTTIQQGLTASSAVNKRLNRFAAFNGATIIDDTYNANPKAFRAAIEVLMKIPGKKIVVAGDMGELGEHADYYHEQLGREAKHLGVDDLYTVGALSSHTARGFGEQAHHFNDKKRLIEALRQKLPKDAVILIKGSKSAKMGEVVEGLL